LIESPIQWKNQSLRRASPKLLAGDIVLISLNEKYHKHGERDRCLLDPTPLHVFQTGIEAHEGWNNQLGHA
jgi:hypothetical protein